MKILHIAEFGRRASGVGTVVENLYREQLALGHDVRIVTINENIAYKHLSVDTCYSQADFCTFLEKWQPDAVLFHSIWAMLYIKFAKILKRKKIPYAVMMHGADSKVNRRSSPFRKWVANTLWFDSFMKKASAIVYLSQLEMDNCLSAKNNSNNVIIPNGCSKVECDLNSVSIHTPVNIIYLGRLEKYHKGVDILMDALDILKSKNYTDARISFYANENDVDIPYLKEKLPAIEDLVSYCGGVYGDEKAKALINADAFILTSRFEGMPMAVLEALSYGVPCILTPGTNMADDLQNAGAGWRAELDAKSVADTIIRAVDALKDDYVSYHKAAYRLSSNYVWEKVAQMHVELMKSIVISNSGNKE